MSRLNEENSECFYAAGIHRLLGDTYLRFRGDSGQAERYFCKGIEVAREQKAKSLELKLCVSIYDLYEVRQNADSFDTMDLVRAKARLETDRVD
jgi:hypothetical protein